MSSAFSGEMVSSPSLSARLRALLVKLVHSQRVNVQSWTTTEVVFGFAGRSPNFYAGIAKFSASRLLLTKLLFSECTSKI